MRRTMKNVLAIFTILALTSVPSFAKTVDFPNKGAVMFKITIPDSWEPDTDEDEVVEATSPKNHVQLSIWELQTKEDVENLGNDIVEILDDHANEIKIVGEPKKASPGGMEGILISGTAVDKEDSHAIEFFALLIATDSKVAVVYIEADANTPKKELNKLEAILKSITPPKGKKALGAVLTVSPDSKATTTFGTDAEKLWVVYVGFDLKETDKIKTVWTVVDVGDDALKNKVMGELVLTGKAAAQEGTFSLSKPDSGWLVGKYRVDVLVNDKVVEKLDFTIEE